MARDLTSDSPGEVVAKKIRFLMRTESMTISEMADRIGVTPDHLRYVIDGISRPTVHLLEKICATFNMKLEFFGKDVTQALAKTGIGQESREAPRSIAEPLAFTPDSRKRKAQPIGVIPEEKAVRPGEKPRKKRDFDLAELAAHHQALLECLIELKILPSDRYLKKVEDVRKRAGLD